MRRGSAGGLEQIVPDAVRVAVLRHDLDAGLFPSEEFAVVGCVEQRRREFATVRHCARTALAELGAPVGAVPPGPDGAPQWPEGVVGNMTHCAGYRAAAVAWRSMDLASIGIDAEPDQALPATVLRRIASAREAEMLGRLSAHHPIVAWDRLLFSAKEAVVKACWPLGARWASLHGPALVLQPDGTFSVEFAEPQAFVGAVSGAWALDGGYLTTAAWTSR